MNQSSYLTFKLRGSKIDALLDTGSFFSLLSHNTARKLNIKTVPLNEGNARRLFSANGSQLKIMGTASISLNICSLILPVSVHIVENLNEHLILGREFLRSSSAVLDFKTSTVTFSDTLSVPLSSPTENVQFVRAIESVFVPPQTEMIIKVSCPKQFNNKDVLITHLPNKQFSAFAVANSCSRVCDNETHCRILNFKNSNLVIPAGQKIGHVEKLDDSCHNISMNNSSFFDVNNPLLLPPVAPHILEEFAKQYSFNINPDLPEEYRIKALTLFYHKKDAFARGLEDLKKFNKREFEFHLTDNKPVYTRQYKMSDDRAKIMDYHINEWIKQGILEESYNYDFNNPTFLVPKASLHSAPPEDRLNPKHYRCVTDLRRLNSKIRKQIVYNTSPADILNEITKYRRSKPTDTPLRSRWFSTLDMLQGFCQIEIVDRCRDPLSITIMGGKHLRFRTAPFGLSVSPYLFSNVIQELFHDLRLQEVLHYYVDDLICFTPTLKEHFNYLSQIFQILIDNDLKCSVAKSFFFYNRIRYLGIDITENGLAVPNTITRTLNKLKTMKMKNKKDVQKFLGYILFFKSFIKNLSARTYNLRQLTHNDTKFAFSPQCQAEREDIISELQKAPTLQSIDPYSPIHLIIDSSYRGIGVTALQHAKPRPTREEIMNEVKTTQAGKTKLVPVLHLSYSIGKNIKSYPSTQLELYGLLKTIQSLNYLVKTKEIHVYSDNIGCTAFDNLKLGNARQRRMLAYLQGFNLTLHYTKGKLNCADYLSRLEEYLDQGEKISWLPPSDADLDEYLLSVKTLEEMCSPPLSEFTSYHTVSPVQNKFQPESSSQLCRSALLCNPIPSQSTALQVAAVTRQKTTRRNPKRPAAPPSPSSPPQQIDTTPTPQAESELQPFFDLGQFSISAEVYENDVVLGPIYRFLVHDELSSDKTVDYKTVLLSDHFIVRDEKMFHINTTRSKKKQNANGSSTIVLAIPKRFQHSVLMHGHCNFGHFAGEKLFSLLRNYVYFKGLYEASFQTAKSCLLCQRTNINRSRQVAPMQNITRHPVGETFYMDHRVLSKRLKNGVCALLVMTDSYSNFTMIEPVTDLGFETTSKALVKRILPLFPQWKNLISDRHATFKGHSLKYLNRIINVKHHFSSSLHPRGHAIVERINAEVNRLVRRYASTDDEIPGILPLIEYILNVNVASSHGYSPFEILFGQKPAFNLNQTLLESAEPLPSVSQYVSWIKDKLKLIHADVDENVRNARLQQKQTYDKKFRTAIPTFKEGDLCWLEKLKPPANSRALVSHKFFDGPFYISKVVSRDAPTDSSLPNSLETCEMGVAYQLIDARSGKVLKSLINSRRLKPYVGTEAFEKKFPPLVPRKPVIQSAAQSPRDQHAVKHLTSRNDGDQGNHPTQLPNDWFSAKNIVRQRKRANQLEFLVRFTDNSSSWVQENDVSDELKRRYFLKKASNRRRYQREARAAFKDD